MNVGDERAGRGSNQRVLVSRGRALLFDGKVDAGSITYTVLASGNLRWSNEKTRACARVIEKLGSTKETGESSVMPTDFNCGRGSLDDRQLPYRR